MNLDKLKIGNIPEEVNVVIEIPFGSKVKYELDKESGAILADRFLPPAMYFPFNYGFIPHTNGEDGDPLDVLVLAPEVVPGTVICCRIIGMLEMEDEAGIDTKIIALPKVKVDPMQAHIQTMDDIPETEKNKIRHFFDHYKDLEKDKWVKTKDFLGKDAAIEAIKKSIV